MLNILYSVVQAGAQQHRRAELAQQLTRDPGPARKLETGRSQDALRDLHNEDAHVNPLVDQEQLRHIGQAAVVSESLA